MNGYKRTDIIVWIDDNEYWDRLYLRDGKFYIKVAPYDYKPLDNYHIRDVQAGT